MTLTYLKSTIIILLGAVASVSYQTYAQVGVNVKNPQGVFHVDGQNDTNGTTNTGDDVVVLSNGNVGIGTIAPSVKLEINTGGTSTNVISGFKLVDGSQGDKRVLTSDANGLASWDRLMFSSFTRLPGVVKSLNYLPNTSNLINSGYSITFPEAGTYLVTLGIMIIDSQPLGSKKYIVQLMPTSVPTNWNNPSARYKGSYEAYADNADGRPRIYYSQALTVPANQLTAYLIFAVNFGTIAGNVQLYLGENGYTPCPQCTGGSFVRIN